MFETATAAMRGLQAVDSALRHEAALFLAQNQSNAACEALLAALGDSDPNAHEAIIHAIVQHDTPDRIARLVSVLREEQPARRNAALSTLIEIGARTPEALIAALEHPSTVVRLHVAEVLGDLRDPTVPEALIAHLADSNEYPNVRHAAAQALGKIGDLAATPALIAAAEQADFWVRFSAVEALGRLGDPRAVGPLGRLLREDPWMRPAIVEALGNIGQVEAIPDLAAALEDSNDAVRAASIEALLKIVVEPASSSGGYSSTVLDSLRPLIPAAPLQRELNAHLAPNSTNAAYLLGWLAPLEALSDLIGTLGHEEETLRQAAVEAVLRYGPAAVGALLEALRRPEGLARENAAELLGILAGPAEARVVAALADHLDDPSPGVRQAVVRALGAVGGEAAYAGILRALSDADSRDAALDVITQLRDPELIGYLQRYLYGDIAETRAAAAQALSLLGDETSVSILLNATRLPDEAVRMPAANALGRVRSARGVAVLIEALGDRDWLVRQKAIEALGHIPDGRAVAALLPLAQEPEWRVRRALVTALASLGGDQRTVEALHGMADDPNSWVRRLVMDLVAGLDDSRTGDILTKGLHDTELSVRVSALWSIGRRRDPASAPAAAACLADAQPRVRLAAARALVLIDTRLAAARLPELLNDPDEMVRREVADALGESGEAAALGPLAVLLKDDAASVRERAAEALAANGTTKAIESLVAALCVHRSRPLAQSQLARLGPAALRVLLATARAAEPELRAASAESLGLLRQPQALPTLRLLMRDIDASVREAAEAAVNRIGAAS